jgi:chitodextrinase
LNESASSEPLVQRTLDTETPTIPAGVTAGIITGNSIAISWTASTDNVGVVRYAIFLDDTEFDTTSFTNYTITGLEQATEYKIKIRARDAASNESEDSETLTLSTLDTEAPTAPTGLTAGTITATSIVISWTASTDNVGVAGYAVFVGGSEVGNTTSTIFMIPDLEQGIQYTITVRARDAALNESESSEPILLSTLDTEAPTTPTAVIAGNVTGTSIAISWTASTDNIEVIEYGIFVGGAEVGTTSNTNFTITGLEQGTSYTITVRARDAALNESPHSAELSQATLDTQAPTTPASLQSGTITVTSIAMSWTASTDNVGVTSYTIYRDNAELFSTSGTTYTATGLDPGTSYEFYVVARDAAGNESLPSNLLIASTQADTEAPTEPFNLTASGLSEFSIRLNWTAATDNIGVTGYFIYQDGAQIGSTTGGLTYTASGLLPESEHTYSVSAVDEAGNESEQSNPATASTFSEPDTESPSVPASLNANAITYNSLHLQWSASTDNVGVEYYAIFRNGVEIDTSATTEYDVTALEPLTSYDFFVVAYDAAANPSINSDTLTLTTKKLPDIIAPSIPQNLTISDTLDTGMRFSWTPSTDNDGVADYLIYMNNKLIAISDTSAYLIENLKPLVEYNFFVAARDSSGNISEASSQLQFAITDPGPDLIAPTTPVNLTATDSTETSITLMWNSAYDWFGVTDYWLYVNDILSLITSDTTATVNGLTHDNEYRFSLSASDAAGNFSGRSDTLVAHTLGLTTGIEEYSFNNLFHIRSLESGIAIHISPTPEIRDLIVRIVNLQGVVVSMDHINSVNTEMSIETVLKPGVYVLQCLDGHHTYSQSFLVL